MRTGQEEKKVCGEIGNVAKSWPPPCRGNLRWDNVTRWSEHAFECDRRGADTSVCPTYRVELLEEVVQVRHIDLARDPSAR